MSYVIFIQVQNNGQLSMKYMPNEDAALELLKKVMETEPGASAAVIDADVVAGKGFHGAVNCDIDGNGLPITGVRASAPRDQSHDDDGKAVTK